jgi:hypothetical protein
MFSGSRLQTKDDRELVTKPPARGNRSLFAKVRWQILAVIRKQLAL